MPWHPLAVSHKLCKSTMHCVMPSFNTSTGGNLSMFALSLSISLKLCAMDAFWRSFFTTAKLSCFKLVVQLAASFHLFFLQVTNRKSH